jgi:carbamoyltransferase
VQILGISAFYHDSAAALVTDGEIRAAVQEERFTRKKHDFEFPEHSIRYCLQAAKLQAGKLGARELDYVVFYDKPFLKFERILETYLQYAPLGFRSFRKAIPLWLKRKLWIKSLIEEALTDFRGKILFTEHHQSHAASAFYPSPFDQAAIITTDGVGEWTTTSIGYGEQNKIKILQEIYFPHSLGMLYSAFTYYTGFKVNSGEYKVMGLAPYGNPVYVQKILDNLIDIKEDGSFKLNMKYFNYTAGLTMTSRHFDRLFGGVPRKPESPVRQVDMDLARSVQDVIEIVLNNMARFARNETGATKLCLAGGVALNCVANSKVLSQGLFEDIWIQPAAGDAGGALGAALAVWYQYLGNPRSETAEHDRQKGSYLGPEYTDAEILNFLRHENIPFKKYNETEVLEQTARLIAAGKVIGWFQGRMEYGPRALGTRSILGDARNPGMQKRMNLKIKYRESFRPFAPAVLAEEAGNYFIFERESPYMLFTAGVKPELRRDMTTEEKSRFGLDKLNVVRSSLPAITHIDYSARLQTVHRETNPEFWRLLKTFQKLTGCAVVINTSFNVRGEPIVCTPGDAYKCFMRTEMDYLVLGNYILAKTDQPEEFKMKYKQEKFELD